MVKPRAFVKIAKKKNAPITLGMSARPSVSRSACIDSASTDGFFVKFNIEDFH